MNINVVIQPHPGENSIAAIATMLSYYGCEIPLSEMREHNVTSRGGSTPEQMQEMAARYGLETEILSASMDDLRKLKFPVIVKWKEFRYCIIKSIRYGIVSIADPARGEYTMTDDAFEGKYEGTVLIMTPGEGFKKGGKRPSLFKLIGGRLDGARRELVILGILNMLAVGLNLLMIRSTRLMLDVAEADPGKESWLKDLMSNDLIKDADAYRVLVIAMSVILILMTLVNMGKTLLIYNTAYTVAAESGTRLFNKIMSQPMAFFEQYRSGEIIQRMEDNSDLDLSLIRTIVPRIMDLVMTVIYFILMLTYHWKAALLCVSVEVLYFLASMMLRNRIRMQSLGRAVSTSDMNTTLLNGMNTIETIKTGGHERMYFTGWKKTQEEFNNNRMDSTNLTAVSNVLDSLHDLFSQAILLFAGAYFMINGEFTFGIMAALQSVLYSFRGAFSNCINMMNSLQGTRTDIERIEDILQRDSMEEYPMGDDYEPDKLEGRLEVSHLSYRYHEGDHLALEDITFNAEPGQLIAIVGSSGCGKSTLLKCLLALYQPESGEVRYGGYTREEIPDVVFHSSVTAVDQECVIFEDSIINNLTMWDSTVEDYEMILAARDAQIHNRIMQESNGYYSAMVENGRNFSGGELQRIELARALSAEPTILLLDEFTSALDAITEAKVFESIRQKGTTCVIVAHRLSTVALCDSILVMDAGKIVQRGTHEELYNTEGLYRKLLQVPGES